MVCCWPGLGCIWGGAMLAWSALVHNKRVQSSLSRQCCEWVLPHSPTFVVLGGCVSHVVNVRPCSCAAPVTDAQNIYIPLSGDTSIASHCLLELKFTEKAENCHCLLELKLKHTTKNSPNALLLAQIGLELGRSFVGGECPSP